MAKKRSGQVSRRGAVTGRLGYHDWYRAPGAIEVRARGQVRVADGGEVDRGLITMRQP